MLKKIPLIAMGMSALISGCSSVTQNMLTGVSTESSGANETDLVNPSYCYGTTSHMITPTEQTVKIDVFQNCIDDKGMMLVDFEHSSFEEVHFGTAKPKLTDGVIELVDGVEILVKKVIPHMGLVYVVEKDDFFFYHRGNLLPSKHPARYDIHFKNMKDPL